VACERPNEFDEVYERKTADLDGVYSRSWQVFVDTPFYLAAA
jgi:hypothetical protein